MFSRLEILNEFSMYNELVGTYPYRKSRNAYVQIGVTFAPCNKENENTLKL